MKRDEILNMPAGQEMDVLIAEKVMGLIPCTAECHKPGNIYYIPGPCHAQKNSPNQGGGTHCYSTDIAAAWQVVDKMAEKILNLFLIQYAYHRTYVAFAQIQPDNNDKQWVEGNDEYCTSLAICRAALLVLLEDECH